MNYNLNQLAKDLNSETLQKYWPNFELVAYALYDQNNVYLFNHLKFNDSNSYKTLNWNEQFVGNTLILFEGYPTAITNIDYYNHYEELYSILVHELFHGFQYLKGEKRFPNEILGITYPITLENIELRYHERKSLYNAVLEDDQSKKMKFLQEFIAYRKKRTEVMSEHVMYENLIETVEGPAWYVEFKAYSDKSSLSSEAVLIDYGANLLNIHESTTNIRKSCYSSGLFMCLLLDELAPDWKEKFFDTELTIYDLMMQFTSDPGRNVNNVEISSDTKKAVNDVIALRKKQFEQIESQPGTKLFIEGEITPTQFDPMNIISFEDKLLHKNFLKVLINEKEFFIQQPAITYSEDGLKNITKLFFILQEEPIEKDNTLIVHGVGKFYGRYTKQGNIYYLNTCS